MRAALGWFWRWYRRRGTATKILVALVIIATFMGCFGVLTPPSGQRRETPARPAGALLDQAPGDFPKHGAWRRILAPASA